MASSWLDVFWGPQLWLFEQHLHWRRMASIPNAMQRASETRVGVTPCEVVFEEHTLRLLRYRRQTPATFKQPVLFCYALVNRPYILDLQPEKSVVRHYLERGFEVYMIDWGVPSDADRSLTLEHYVCGLLERVVSWILREHGARRLHLIGYCMGGTMAAVFTALNPTRIRTLTLLAAPIDFGDRESLASLWSDASRFDVDAFVDAYGNCPAIFLQTCFLFMRPVQNLVEKYIALWEHIEEPRFVANHFAMESWVNDNIPVAGETFREFVKRLYQRNELVRGKFTLGRRRVQLRRITCPLLLLTAKSDHLVIPASTNRIQEHVGARDVTSMMIEAGHVGLVVSGKAQQEFWPNATRWLAERSTFASAREERDGESVAPKRRRASGRAAQKRRARAMTMSTVAAETRRSETRGDAQAHAHDFAGFVPEQGAKREPAQEPDARMKPIGDSSSGK